MFDDRYVKPLSSNQFVFLCLNKFFPDDISKKIIVFKNKKEKDENILYHINRWENIAGSHFILRDSNVGKFSYIIDYGRQYVIKKDHKNIFYNVTGISYQIIEFLHKLIKLKYEIDSEDMDHEYGYYKEWLNYDDKLYSVLSKKIMDKMKKK
jgi:hypothetical protein